ncbi:MAG: threonine-phosphate decarboxylase CobD [Thermodesulfobacteriota bacterium]|nr:threonine-phosphate decarboxylase CobD [Thermodesulfobacteriota bacterium]
MKRPFHGGNLVKASLKYKIEKDKIVDFSANINPLGLSPRAREVLLNSIDLAIYYPDPDCNSLVSEIAAYLGIDRENIMVGNGSCDLIHLVSRTCHPQKALILLPSFSEYEYAVKISGGKCRFLTLLQDNSFLWKPETILKHLNGVNMVFICNPNNPTGSIISKEAILFIVDACEKKDIRVVIDEAFIDFIDNYDDFTLIGEAVSMENILILRSLTKFFGLAGLRVGYLVGERQIIKKISRYRVPWAVNTMGQIAAKEALRDKKFIEGTRDYIGKERNYLWDKLKKIEGIVPYPATANFIFCRISDRNINSSLLTEKLGCQGILIRDCETFRGLNNRFIRVAVKKREDNLKLISALNKIFNG